jgi:hypothetical protein
LPYEFDPLLGRELVGQNCARCHELSLIDSRSARNYPVCSPNGLVQLRAIHLEHTHPNDLVAPVCCNVR